MENLLTVKEYADRKKLSSSTIYKYIRTGKVESTLQNGKKYIIDNDSQEVIEIEQKPNIILRTENLMEQLELELEMLRKRVKELESYTKLFDSVVQENIELRKENRQLVTATPFKKKETKLIEAMNYLISLGLIQKRREKIYKKIVELSDEERFVKKGEKIYFDLKKYSYKDLI